MLAGLLLTGCNDRAASKSGPASGDRGASNGGPKAPDFSGETVDGLPVIASEYRGKVVLLDFWATWCPPCRAEIPHGKSLVEKFQGKPFALIGISADESRDELRQFLADRPLPWVNISDPANRLNSLWKIKALPTFVLIGADGKIVERWIGGGRSASIERAVEKAVAAAEAK